MVKDGTGKLVLIDHGLGFPSSNTPAWGNAQIMEHCRKMKIPEECRHWIDQWDKMEKHMKALGFRDVEIKATHERVAALADPKYKKFEDLRGVWDTGYGYPGHEAGMSPAAHWKRQAW